MLTPEKKNTRREYIHTKITPICQGVRHHTATFATAFVLPVTLGYVVHYAACFVYDKNNCSRPWRIGSAICESSHSLSTESRKYLYMFINQTFGAFIGYTMSVLTAMRMLNTSETAKAH
jgi:hypothetical protein